MKFVEINSKCYWSDFHETFTSGKSYDFKNLDKILLKKYGIECVDDFYLYKVVNDSRFSLLILEWPDLIVKITEKVSENSNTP